VEAAERFADGQESEGRVITLCNEANAADRNPGYQKDVWPAAVSALTRTSDEVVLRNAIGYLSLSRPRQADVMREVFGNPFRPAEYACQSPTVRAIAQAVYEQKRWEELPVLADCMEDDGGGFGAGKEGVLSHLRSPGPHFRGCWALDLVLGLS
jgi:hypothetical protein